MDRYQAEIYCPMCDEATPHTRLFSMGGKFALCSECAAFNPYNGEAETLNARHALASSSKGTNA